MKHNVKRVLLKTKLYNYCNKSEISRYVFLSSYLEVQQLHESSMLPHLLHCKFTKKNKGEEERSSLRLKDVCQ